MSRTRADLRALVAQARAAGATGEPSAVLARSSCTLVLDALEVTEDLPVDALVAPVASSRDPLDESLLASASGRGWLVSGSADHVARGADAASLLTVVRSRPFAGRARGIRVYLVDAATPGVTNVPLSGIDIESSARVGFDAVHIGDDRAVGPSRDATGAIDVALDCITIVAVAEMVGAADAARRAAMQWVTSRVQFGEPLARRQAIAHRVADMTIACDAVALLLDHALATAVENGGRPDPLVVVTAKLAANERLPEVTAGAHQLHGGEGYYADRPLHRWHRRVTSLAMQFGDRRALRARSAETESRATVSSAANAAGSWNHGDSGARARMASGIAHDASAAVQCLAGLMTTASYPSRGGFSLLGESPWSAPRARTGRAPPPPPGKARSPSTRS